METRKCIGLAEDVAATPDLTQSNIQKLRRLNWSFKAKFPALDGLYHEVDELGKIVGTLQSIGVGFFSCIKYQQQLLEECSRLLDDSNKICITLYSIVGDRLKSSASWKRMDENEIRSWLNVIPNASAKLRICTISLNLLVKVMQLPDKTDDSGVREVGKAMNQIRHAEPIIKSDLKSASAEFTPAIQQALSKSADLCDFVTKALI